MKEMKNETYWMWTARLEAQTEKFQDGEPVVVEDRRLVKDVSVDESGHYSSLKYAVLGFLEEELGGRENPVILKQEGSTFKLITDGYTDQWGQPVGKTLMQRWKRGEVRELTHFFYEVYFIKKTIELADSKDMEAANEIVNNGVNGL